MIHTIIDCDPGHDDAIAILLAGRAKDLSLIGVTSVAGNQTIEKTTENARRIVELGGLTCPVVRGAARPILRAPIVAEMIHGESGLDGIDLPTPKRALAGENAVPWLAQEILKQPEPVTLIPIGPLTNIAVLLLAFPEIRSNIEKIVIMGGAFGRGNRTPSAEFNILADPEAAKIVFDAGIPLYMVGLDATHQVMATPSIIERIRKMDNQVSPAVTAWLSFFTGAYNKFYGMEGGPLHDPLAVAAVLDSDVVQFNPMYVDVETRGGVTDGRTVCDIIGVTRKEPNAHVATKVNTNLFWDILFDALSKY